ncbi:MAG: hypothetical protein IKX19_04215, partial [Clostridia bacterium]|nr:hypothetical protein [Clostridia bacterium]
FGALMLYMNRVSTMLKAGEPAADTAVLYGAESDWMGNCMPPEDLAEPLAREQIAYDFIPADVFSRPERYHTDLSSGLSVNGRRYRALILPACDHLAPAVKDVLPELEEKNVLILDAGKISPAEMPGILKENGVESPRPIPANRDLRFLHVRGEDGDVWMFVNEGEKAWSGTVDLTGSGSHPDGSYCLYDAWENGLRHVRTDGENRLRLTVEPLHSAIVVSGVDTSACSFFPPPFEGKSIPLDDGWMRSTCRAVDYPRFENEKPVCLPDRVAEEMSRFSGFIRYRRTLTIEKIPSRAVLILSDAHEGVELFVNGKSLGIQVAPPFRYEIGDALREGENEIRIEVATTLERENADAVTPDTPSGINGRCSMDFVE